MPVLETDFLKALIDPDDKLHGKAVRALEKVRDGKWHVASPAFLELDLVLKKSGILLEDRISAFEALKPHIPLESTLKFTHQTMAVVGRLQRTCRFPHFYFDSLHLGIAIEHDGEIVSSDRDFDTVREVKRIPLEKL